MSRLGRKRKLDDSPNRLFLSYLKIWKDEASAKESKAYHTYNKAYKSLVKYPLPLQCGKEAIILEHFGDKICGMLDSKLLKESTEQGLSPREYLDESRNVPQSWWESLENVNQTKKLKITKKKAPSGVSNKRQRTYIPAKNSGGYAILLALYKNTALPNSNSYMKKAELQREAQQYSTKSFTTSDPGSQYTAWSSMATLLNKNVVKKYSNPAKFELTESGMELAAKLELEITSNHESNSIKTVFKPTNKQTYLMELSDSDSDTTSRKPTSQSIDLTLSSSDEEMSPTTNSSQSKPSTSSDTNYQLPINSEDKIEFQLYPSEFEVVLCVDSREVCGDKRKKEMRRELSERNIRFVERVLQIGDFIWIAKEKNSTSSKELVLDYIIERKCMSDLAQSIRDGRFHEQKIRLKQCGVKNVVYLVEDLNQIQHQSLPEKTLRQALMNTQITDSIFVKYSKNMAGTALYLSIMTKKIEEMYKNKTLQACEMNMVTSSWKIELPSCKFLTFHDFNDESMKSRGLSITEMFIRQLMQIHGMSYDKSQAITSIYPTPYLLYKAYKTCSNNKTSEELLSKVKFGLLQRNLGIKMSRTIHHVFNKS